MRILCNKCEMGYLQPITGGYKCDWCAAVFNWDFEYIFNYWFRNGLNSIKFK